MIYFDSTYLVRLYFEDAGYERVRYLATTDVVICAQHGRAEVISAFHRKLREKIVTARLFKVVLQEFLSECRSEAFKWLPLSEVIFERIELVYRTLPVTTFLRAADAMHLAAARENGLQEIYSNDSKLLSAATHFGLRGVDIIN